MRAFKACLAIAALGACAAPAAHAAKDDLLLVPHPFAGPPTTPDNRSHHPVFSADGRYLAYASEATNLVAGDTNARRDVFRYDTVTGETLLVSRAGGPAGMPGSDHSGDSVSDGALDISANGRFVVFESDADGLAPGDASSPTNVYVRDVDAGQTILVSRNNSGQPSSGDDSRKPTISSDGSRVAFQTSDDEDAATAANMPGNPTKDDVLVRDLGAGTTTVASVADDEVVSDGRSGSPSISGDGTKVCFYTEGGNLGADVSDPTEPGARVVLRDMAAGTTRVVGIFPETGLPDASYDCLMSRDGKHVAFQDGNGYRVYVRDLAAGTTLVASRGDGADGPVTDEFSTSFDLSADGRFVVFATDDPGVSSEDTDGTGPFDWTRDAFLRDTALNTTTFLNRGAGAAGAASDGERIFGVSIDDVGRHAAFATDATNFSDLDYHNDAVPFDDDVFIRDLGDPPPLPSATLPDTIAPALSGLSLSRKRFRVGPRATPVAAAAAVRRRARRGTTIRLSLSEFADVRIAVQRLLPGVRVRRGGNASCVKASRRNLAAARRAVARRRSVTRLEGRARARAIARGLRRLRCSRPRGAGVLVRRDVAAGPAAIPFSGRIGSKALRPGSYRFLIGATDPAGNGTAKRSKLAFRIVKR